jgi:phage tail tape-measure protein
MNTVLIIIAGVLVAAAVYYFGFYKRGKINDRDGDFIPDEVEDTYEKVEDFVEDKVEDVEEFVEDAKEFASEVKRRAKAVKEELADVIEESKDVISALKGNVTKTKLRQLTKKQLREVSKAEFGVEYPANITKTNLVNKVYSNFHKK